MSVSQDVERELRRMVRQAKRVLEDPSSEGERMALASQVEMAEETLRWVDACTAEATSTPE